LQSQSIEEPTLAGFRFQEPRVWRDFEINRVDEFVNSHFATFLKKLYEITSGGFRSSKLPARGGTEEH